MKNWYKQTEKLFERITSVTIAVLGNSVTFIIALFLVLFWLANKLFYLQNIHELIRDVIISITFLTLFIIQKAFNRFSASLHFKVNELVTSHEPARNEVINLEEKSEHEIRELSREHSEMALQRKEEEKTEPVNLNKDNQTPVL